MIIASGPLVGPLVVYGSGDPVNKTLAREEAFTLGPPPTGVTRSGPPFPSLRSKGPVEVAPIVLDNHDLTGKRVVAREIPVNDCGGIQTVIDLNGDLANGVYLVSITVGDKRYTERLVIAK